MELYNICLSECKCPQVWYITKVIAILKPGQITSDAKSFRPISLLSCVRKVFEKLILVRLEYWAEKNKIVSNTQYGFRKCRSTRDCLALFTADINIAFVQKKEALACFLDILGAYDNVLIGILCEKLSNVGIPSSLVLTLWGLLKQKEMHFFINNEEKLVRTGNRGLPQGSVLS